MNLHWRASSSAFSSGAFSHALLLLGDSLGGLVFFSLEGQGWGHINDSAENCLSNHKDGDLWRLIIFIFSPYGSLSISIPLYSPHLRACNTHALSMNVHAHTSENAVDLSRLSENAVDLSRLRWRKGEVRAHLTYLIYFKIFNNRDIVFFPYADPSCEILLCNFISTTHNTFSEDKLFPSISASLEINNKNKFIKADANISSHSPLRKLRPRGTTWTRCPS